MRLADAERFTRSSVRAFEVLFGSALVVEVLTDVLTGGWGIHTGRLYPWRYIGVVPLWPPSLLAIVWALTVASGIAFALGALRPLAPRLAAVLMFAWVIERYSNHGALLFLVAFYLALAPPRPAASDFEEARHPNLGLVRAQLLIVYVFSALNKISHGFPRGESLANLVGWRLELARPLSIAVVLAELALPVLLVRSPRVGVVGVVLLHLGFVVLMPGLWSFALVMVAMSVLFLGEGDLPTRRGPARSP